MMPGTPPEDLELEDLLHSGPLPSRPEVETAVRRSLGEDVPDPRRADLPDTGQLIERLDLR